jgi:hypothetical protein
VPGLPCVGHSIARIVRAPTRCPDHLKLRLSIGLRAIHHLSDTQGVSPAGRLLNTLGTSHKERTVRHWRGITYLSIGA